MLVSMLIWLLSGSITHIWMFINSMQLLAYTALLGVPETASLTLFMKQILDALRLKFLDFTRQDYLESSSLHDFNTKEMTQYQDLIESNRGNFNRLYF